MAMGPQGREIDAALDEVRAFLPDLMPDTYVIERSTTRVPDGFGGFTTGTMIVEPGICSLTPANRLGDEGIRGAVVISTSGYIVRLPLGTTLTETDVLIINGTRRFEVTNILKGGVRSLNVVANVEERT